MTKVVSHRGGLRTALVLFLAFLVVSLVAFGQERVGQINGSATDQTGAVIPGVSVTITNKSTNRTMKTATGSDGSYILREVDPGHYGVKFEAKGFSTTEFGDVSVLVGRTIKIDASLKVGGTEQMVEVTAAAPQIDTQSTAVAHNVTAEEFDRMPKTRSFQSLALTSPSVSSGDVEGGIQVNGASGAENQFNVDGLSTNSLISGQSRQNASFEILQEVQVKTGGISAEFGGALGGVISAITKSGGNSFHGDGHYYYAGNAISAGPVARLFMDPNNLITVTNQQDNKQKSNQNEIGYSLGGYFIKNKLYFFSAASPRFVKEERLYLTSDNKSQSLTRDSTFWQAYNKLSWDATKRIRLTASYLWTPSHNEGQIVAYTGYGNRTTSTAAALLPQQSRGTFSPQSNYNGTIDFVITNTALLSVKAARFWDNYKSLGVLGQSAVEWGKPSTSLPFAIPDSLKQAQGYSNIPRVQNTEHDLATRTLFQVDFSKFQNFFGQHDFKVGIGRQKNVNNVDNSYPGGGYVTLQWDTAFVSNGVSQRGTYGYYQVDNIGTKGSTGGTIDSLYFQDRYRITKRLTIDAGLRLEKEVVPSFRRDIQDLAFEFGWGQKIAPRVGASLDLFGNGKIKLYGSYGLFFDWVKYELSRGTFGGDTWTTTYHALDTLDVLSLSGTNQPGKNLWLGAKGYQDWRIPGFGKDVLDPNIKPMSSDITNIGVEYQLNPKVVFAARYVRNHLRNAIEDVGTLDENGSEAYIYGNPGSGITKMSAPSGATPSFQLPKPTRVYNAMEFTLTRRFAKNWFASGSYVYSRLRGNYSGLASTDEITPPSTGRSSAVAQQASGSLARPGTAASRYYDLDTILWDSKGHLDVTGPLGTDRPHVLKLYGSYTTKWGTEIGGVYYAGSGTPVSTYVMDVQNIPLFVNGRGDLGRTPTFTQTDMVIAQEIKLKFKESARLRFEFNAQNLFNQKTSRYTYNFLNRYRVRSSEITMTPIDLRKGYDYNAMIAATADAKTAAGALDPRFGKGDVFNPGFAGRFGLKFIF